MLLLAVLVVGAPYWLVRMATSGRYRAGLAGRLGCGSQGASGRCGGAKSDLGACGLGGRGDGGRSNWCGSLREALPGWVIAVSTTTETGQRLARERFAESPVFYHAAGFRVGGTAVSGGAAS